MWLSCRSSQSLGKESSSAFCIYQVVASPCRYAWGTFIAPVHDKMHMYRFAFPLGN